MPYEVKVGQVEPRPTAVVRRRATSDQLPGVIPAACGEVWQFIRSSGLPHTGRNMALYLDGDMNIEVGVIVSHPFSSDGPVICSATPGGMAATAIHLGPYDRIGEANRAILDWCAAQGYRVAGPSWEIYDHWNDDPSKLRTDIFYLVDGNRQSATP
jgi:effector-binding domain-containing protein